MILEPNGNIVNSRKNISNTFDNTSCCSRRENLKKFGLKVNFDCDTKFVQTETSRKNLNFIFKASASTLNPLKEASGTKCDRKFAQTQTSQKNINFIFAANPSTSNHPKEASDTKGDAKFVHAQTSERNINFIFEASPGTSNAPEGTSDISNIPKPSPRRKYLKSSDAKEKCDCDRTKSPKKPKLKIYIHRTTSTSRSKVRSPLNVSNLSLPCKSSQLIVRLFEADPSLSDSCLILMRKRFEKDINNACSCMNDILRKLDDSTIKQLHLNCEIRPGRVDLNLSCKNGENSKIRWFLARVPTCSNVHKRVSYTGNVESCENPRDRRGEPRRSMELPVDADCCEGAAKRSGEFEERRVAFYSVCSNHSLMQAKQSSTLGNEIEKEEREKQLNLAWAGEGEKQMDFVLSSRLINSQDKDTVTSAKTDIERPGKYNNEISDRKVYQSTSLNREKEGLEQCRTEEVVDVNKEIEICDDGFVEDSIQDSENHLIELYDIKCDCSLDSFEEGVFRKDYSTTRGCYPEECFCDAFCTSDRIVNHSSSETKDLDNKNTKVEGFCHLNEDALKLQVSTSQTKKNNSKLEDCISKDTSCLGIEREVVRKEEHVFELKQNIFQMENASKEEISNLDSKEKKKVMLKVEEKYSADSICASNSSFMELSCDTKCSCCGEDLPNPSSVEEINIEANKRSTCTNKTLVNLKDHETLNLIVTENATTSEAVRESSNLHYLEFKMAPNVHIESNTTSIHDQSSTVPDNNSTDFSQKCLGNCEKNSIENPCDQEATFIDNPPNFSTYSKVKDSPITESLFVFCNSNMKQFSSTSNSSTDEECSSNENHRARSQEIGKSKSPCRRAIPTKCHRKSIYSITCKPSYSMRNVPRVNCAKHSSKEKTNKKDVPIVPRYKNRLWRGPMAPGSLCSSFPAIDRIKYLIRKKLRKLLLEERDKGTSTSKTFLRNDRYLVSISSGKLNGGRIIRESCSSTRCPFTTRNRYEARGEAEETFTEGSCLVKNKNIFGDIIKARCQRMIQGNDILKRIRMANVPRSQKYDSKLIDTQDFIGERGETIRRSKWKDRNGERFLVNSSWNNKEQKNSSSIMSLNSTRMFLLKDDGDHFLSQKLVRRKHRDLKEQGRIKNLSTDIKSMRNYSRRSYYERGFSGSSYERKENRKGMDAEDKTCYDKLRSFEERLSKLERRRDEENNFVNFLSDYEKRVNELDADFRLKLLQYVTLCRSVKNSLMKRLRPDDVYEVNSSSV